MSDERPTNSEIPATVVSPLGLPAALDGLVRPLDVAPRLPDGLLAPHPRPFRLQLQVLYNRLTEAGASPDPADLPRLLADELRADWRNPGPDLPNMETAVRRIARALDEPDGARTIVVYGDCDADGMTSCAVVLSALRALGAEARAFVPARDDDGRGLNEAAVRALHAEGARLLITTDCGTVNADETALARALGMDVIITDHHPPHAVLADAVALVNPQLAEAAAMDDPSGARDLAGAGVAFRLAEALLRARLPDVAARDAALDALLDLVAVGTVADVVPLSRQNRGLVRAGLDRLRRAPRPGLRALLDRAGIRPEDMTERDIAFAIAPRLNAGPRMGEPMLPVALLLAHDEAEAAHLAGRLDALNKDRQTLTDLLVTAGRDQARTALAAARVSGGAEPGVLLVGGENWSFGLIGLVAGRLADEFARPVVALSSDAATGESRGSARAPEGSDLVGVLAQRADLFKRFGGHARAAGFTLPTARRDALRAHLEASFAPRPPFAVAPAGPGRNGADATPGAPLRADAVLPLHRISPEVYTALRALAPFGPGWPEPVLLCERARVIGARSSGAEGRTLRLRLRDRSGSAELIVSRRGDLADVLRDARDALPPLDVAFTLDGYRSRMDASLQLTPRIAGLAPARP